MHPLLGELASLSWRREASPRVLGGQGPSARLMALPVTQGPCAGAGRPPSHKRRRTRNTGACVLARPLPAWSPISSTREALGHRDVSVSSLSGKDSRRGAVCPPVREAGGGAPHPPGAGTSGWSVASRGTPQPRSGLWLGGAQIFLGEPIMTFDTKLTMALAGCSGSCSANKWHTLSVALPCFRATNPKTLQQERG